MLPKTSKSKEKSTGTGGTKRVTSLPPVVFITIDPNLENVARNSPLSAKAEAAKKMFASGKR